MFASCDIYFLNIIILYQLTYLLQDKQCDPIRKLYKIQLFLSDANILPGIVTVPDGNITFTLVRYQSKIIFLGYYMPSRKWGVNKLCAIWQKLINFVALEVCTGTADLEHHSSCVILENYLTRDYYSKNTITFHQIFLKDKDTRILSRNNLVRSHSMYFPSQTWSAAYSF